MTIGMEYVSPAEPAARLTAGEPLAPGVRLVLRVGAVVGALAIAFHVAHGQLGVGGHSLDNFTWDWLYDAIVTATAVSCLVRAWLIRRERSAWLALGLGFVFNATGEIYYSIAFGNSGNPPIPSLADLFYLLCYPFLYTGLILLVRARMERFDPSTWLDGAIAAATSAAVISALAFGEIERGASHASAAAVATNLAYPVADMILLGIVVGVFALSGWRPGRAWLLLGIGLGLWAIADTAYAYANANGTYEVGGVLDSLYLVSAWFSACAAWQFNQPARRLRVDGVRRLIIPGAFAIVALAVLLYGGLIDHVHPVAVVLAGAALLLVIIRALWTLHDNVALLAVSQRDAVTDALTGLGNRRKLQTELEHALAHGVDSPTAVFVMFDLDGFKAYNDRFGHLAGDTMLAHLGRRLQASLGGAGTAYRPGGDEFCVLLSVDLGDADMHIAAALAALRAEGEGFSVSASHGRVALPSEADTPTRALRITDDRMYAEKDTRSGRAGRQTHEVLLEVLRDRAPSLNNHVREVGRMALLIGRRLGLDSEELDELRRAADLHDIGKASIPDAILNKPGPLNQEEWNFMRRHTLIGERILSAAPALAPVAALVRSSHERWDGNGYPDGRAGERIPLGARIVFVCDAFDAMTRDRPYARTRSPEQAIAELRRGAGSQFDPSVVAAFTRLWEELAAGGSALDALAADPLLAGPDVADSAAA